MEKPEEVKLKLNSTDGVVIGVTMFISVGIGVYYRFSGGRQKTIKEYFSADKSMGILPVAIALMVSFMSAITLLGVSAENYTYGTQFIVINLSYLIGTPIICYGYLPVFFNVGALSAYEYLEKRFGYGARLTASLAYWIQLLSYSGIVLYAPSLALQATMGFEIEKSIILVGVVCAVYSTMGGIKAVLMTDVFQGGLMYASLFIVIFTAAHKVGGFGEIWRLASEGGRIDFTSVSLDPTVRHTWWNLIIGGMGTFLSLFGVNQVQVQRMMTLKDKKSARIAFWLNWPILSCLSLLTCFSGLAMYSHYRNCDPLTAGRIHKMDELMPLYVMDTLKFVPGLPGLFIAGIFSAGLSTISAGLNSLAAVTLEDYFKPLYARYTGKEFNDKKSVFISKSLVLIFGIICIIIAFAALKLGSVLQASLTVFGVVGGPLLGIFTLGMLVESANQIGAVTGTVISFVFCLWIGFGEPRPAAPRLPVSIEGCTPEELIKYNSTSSSKIFNQDDSSYFYLYRISYMWYSVIGFVITMTIGYVISIISRNLCQKEEDVELNPDLFFPFIARRIRKRRQRKDDRNENTKSNSLYVFNDKNDNLPKNEELNSRL